MKRQFGYLSTPSNALLSLGRDVFSPNQISINDVEKSLLLIEHDSTFP